MTLGLRFSNRPFAFSYISHNAPRLGHWSWIYPWTLEFFHPWAMSYRVSIQTQTPLLSDKCSCKAHGEHFQMTNRIMCHERETLLKLNFFQLVEQHRSWGSVFDIDPSVKSSWPKKKKVKKTEMRMRQSDKKMLAFEYDSYDLVTNCTTS